MLWHPAKHKAATFPAVAGFPAWRNIRTNMFRLGKIGEQFVWVWQNSYSDCSASVKFTDYLRRSSYQMASLAVIHSK